MFRLQAVLLHNGNKFPTIPLAYTNNTKETRELMETVLRLLQYSKYEWKIVVDLKIVAILLGLKGGYPSYPCIFCTYNSRAKVDHYVTKWPRRIKFVVGQYSVTHFPLVSSHKIILPALHIKLGVATQFIKNVLLTNENALSTIKLIFPGKSDAKILGGIFDGPDLRKLLKSISFLSSLTSAQSKAWKAFKDLCSNFFGNVKSPKSALMVRKMLRHFREIGVKVSPKLHLLVVHLNEFPENLGDVSDEHGERAHQQMKYMEKRFFKKDTKVALADYIWTLSRQKPRKHKGKTVFFTKNN